MPVDAERVQAAFLAAVEVADPVQQAAILDRECASDKEMRRRVEALLQAHRDPASLLDRPVVAPLRSADQAPLAPDQDGSCIATADLGRFAGRDGPKEDVASLELGFLEPPTKPGALGRIGHYEVLEVIGHGGFGIVLRALDETLQRVVAVKVLAPQMAATSPARKRFLREARSYAAIRHENVVQVHAVEEQPLPYLVMEFVPGETLQEMLDRTGPLEVPEILRIGRQIAEGLAAAHDTGLIHRDVKPANVLIEAGPQHRVKLTDFGLARAADDASISQSGLVAGTPLYMAPEQARGESLDHRADLFSLGSVLYVMCTGRPPFRANTTLAILKRVCEDTPRPIREIIPEAPAWLCNLITRLHAKDPAERFQSAREVADLLRHYEAELATHGKAVAVSLKAPRSKRPLGIALVAVASMMLVGVLVAILAGWFPLGSGDPANQHPSAPWQPKPPPLPEDLALLTTTFDVLDRKQLPRDAMVRMFGGLDKAPPELVAFLDSSPSRLPRPGSTSWFAQDREGKWLAIGCAGEADLFDARTLAHVKTFGPITGRIYKLAFSPDGKRLAAASWSEEDGAVVWNVETCEIALKLKLKDDCLNIQFSPDGARLLTVGAEDHKPTVWDARSGEMLHRFSAQDQPVCYDVTFTADSKQIVTHASGGAVKVWDAQTWDEIATRPGPELVTENFAQWWQLPLAVSADGKWLAAGSESRIKVFSTAGWKEEWSADTPAAWLTFTPDGRTLLTGPHDCTDGRKHAVARWDAQTGQRLSGSATLGSRGGWATYCLSGDGKTLYGMTSEPAEPCFHAYSADTFEERIMPGHAGRVLSVDISPDGVWIASAGADGTVRVRDVKTRRLLQTIPRPGKTAVHTAFSPDGKTLFGGWSEDGVILAVDPATGSRHDVAVYGAGLQRLAVTPDGTLLAATGDAGVRSWALPRGTPCSGVAGASRSLRAIGFSPDARTLALGGQESLRLFDVATGRLASTLEFPGTVHWVGFRPGSRSLAALGEAPGSHVLLFDVSSGDRKLRLEGNENQLLCGAWRADGGLLATVGATQHTVQLWDFAHAAPKRHVVAAAGPKVQGIDAVALSPEGRHLVTGNSDGTISILRLAKAGEVFRVP
jgi:serine/threonine protein kinase/WD40 repeat protein